MRGQSAWVAPLATAVLTAALLLGLPALVQPGDGGVRVDEEPPLPQIPTGRAVDTRLGDREVRVLGYRARGRDLEVDYEIVFAGCAQVFVSPSVAETAEAVSIDFLRTGSRGARLLGCPVEQGVETLVVRLAEPLGSRDVLDPGGRAVPRGYL